MEYAAIFILGNLTGAVGLVVFAALTMTREQMVDKNDASTRRVIGFVAGKSAVKQ